MVERRQKIISDFTRWAATSAARQGVDLRGRRWYEHIDAIDLTSLFSLPPPLSGDSFDEWHEREVVKLARTTGVPIGWSAKIVNMVTKIRVYIAREGDSSLLALIHPPIDNQLIEAIKDFFPLKNSSVRSDNVALRNLCDLGKPTSGVSTYAEYKSVVRGLQMVADRIGCSLFEVESLWTG
jgi:hypothetical protein